MNNPRRAVVVDDDHRLGKALCANLTIAGYAPRLYEDPRVALKRFQSGIPDIVLVTDHLPYMSGQDLTRQIRRLPGGPEVPIILFADRPQAQGAVSGLESGADDYVAKPFAMRELLARMANHLRRLDLSFLQPLTRLPGNVLIEREIERRIAAGAP